MLCTVHIPECIVFVATWGQHTEAVVCFCFLLGTVHINEHCCGRARTSQEAIFICSPWIGVDVI